ncbi:hypothetical protein MHU86_9624 (mitochondrion) [Fragilaria crotonensis]|nr:hypothetical protein MHU86_9624 [Fragilaria crotonensis]
MKNNRKNLAQTLFIIFLFLINLIFLLCVYYYLYYVPVTAIQAEIVSLHEKNKVIEDTLIEVFKKLEGAEQIKKEFFFSFLVGDGGSSSINPYLKYLCGCACAVVVVIVCVKVWPAPFIAIKNCTFSYILSCFGDSSTETLRFRTVSPEGTSYDWLITSSLDQIDVFIKFTTAPDAVYLPIDIFVDMLQKCADEGTLSSNPYLSNHMIHLVNIVDATATTSQVLPIF